MEGIKKCWKGLNERCITLSLSLQEIFSALMSPEMNSKCSQIPKMEFLAKVVNGFYALTISAINSILDENVWCKIWTWLFHSMGSGNEWFSSTQMLILSMMPRCCGLYMCYLVLFFKFQVCSVSILSLACGRHQFVFFFFGRHFPLSGVY